MAKNIREKAIARKQNADKRPSAYLPNIKISAPKIQIVLDVVRGRKVGDAVAILENLPNGSAPIIKKLIQSACANAEHNLGMDKDDLCVAETYVTQGPIYNKKLNVRGRGRADIIIKRSSHVTVILDQVKA